MLKKFVLLPIFVTAIALLSRCTPVVSGGGTEDVNTMVVTGRVFMEDRTPASDAEVTLLPADYDPVRDTQSVVYADTTDNLGFYSFTVRDSGLYTARIVQTLDRTRAFIAPEAVQGDTTIFPPANLSQPGSIKILLPDSVDRSEGYVYIPGTTITVQLNQTDQFVLLDSVPAGTIPSVNYGAPASLSRTLRQTVQVVSAETTTVFLPEWNYATTLQLNTTPAGADVGQNVYNFPVLVRLSSDNFNFDEAKSDGSDIRFTKSNGIALPCEIERWDEVTRQAEIWVKVDTVYGNDSTHSIVMCWGNPAASSESGAAVVFDSSTGFEGVWHLGETSGKVARDASRNGLTGTYVGGLPRGEPGPTGNCQNIVRSDTDYIDMGDVLNPDMKSISLGAWVRRSAFGAPQALIAKTNGGAPSASYGYLFSFDAANFVHFYMASGGTKWGDDGVFDMSSNATITDSVNWHYVLVVIDRTGNGNCKIYIDGMNRTGNAYGNITTVNTIANTLRLRIGTENDGTGGNKGSIGEATIAFTVRSVDWVKLSYMNQKDPDALVKW